MSGILDSVLVGLVILVLIKLDFEEPASISPVGELEKVLPSSCLTDSVDNVIYPLVSE